MAVTGAMSETVRRRERPFGDQIFSSNLAQRCLREFENCAPERQPVLIAPYDLPRTRTSPRFAPTGNRFSADASTGGRFGANSPAFFAWAHQSFARPAGTASADGPIHDFCVGMVFDERRVMQTGALPMTAQIVPFSFPSLERTNEHDSVAIVACELLAQHGAEAVEVVERWAPNDSTTSYTTVFWGKVIDEIRRRARRDLRVISAAGKR
jgi:hypothetical protein